MAKLLAEDCKLVVSTDKYALLGNDPSEVKEVERLSRKLTNVGTYTTKNLGVDFAAGKPQRSLVRSARLNKNWATVCTARVYFAGQAPTRCALRRPA